MSYTKQCTHHLPPISPPVKDSSVHIMIPITKLIFKNATLPTKKSASSGPLIKGPIGNYSLTTPFFATLAVYLTPTPLQSTVLWHPCKKKPTIGAKFILADAYGNLWSVKVLKDINFKTMQVAIL